MAHITKITVNGVLTDVVEFDNSAQDIDDAATKSKWQSNPNLLDNWYFCNPVNQRGQTSYTGGGYGIDRWYSTGACLIENDGITITDSILEKIQNPEKLNGLTITFSVLGANGKLYTGTRVFNDANDVIFYGPDSEGIQLLFNQYWDGFQVIGNFKAKAAKLELGSQQTLAHLENGAWVLTEIPDYGEQLARCQRYFQLYSVADKRPEKAVDCRPVMRAEPSQDTIVIDGTTYYYNTAEL